MLRHGYPVAEILDAGIHQGSLYYVESALGENTFGDACADGIAQDGSMADEEFSGFLDVMRRHARAQLAGDNRSYELHQFAEFIGVRRAMANTPGLAVSIHAAWEEATDLLNGLPMSLQHGDLHPFNTCPGGIIDLEDAGWAPVGYDVATAVLEATLAEPRWLDGALILEWFTLDQVRTYLAVLDEEFHRFDLPAPSTQIHAFLLCRAINLGSRIHRNASVWEARKLMLAHVLQSFLDSGRVPLAFAV